MALDNLYREEGYARIDYEQIQVVLPYLHKILADMVRFQYFAGITAMEVCTLNSSMIDKKTFAQQHLWQFKRPGKYSNSSRIVLLGPNCQGILAQYSHAGTIFRRGHESQYEGQSYRPTEYPRRIRLANHKAVEAGVLAPDQTWTSRQVYVSSPIRLALSSIYTEMLKECGSEEYFTTARTKDTWLHRQIECAQKLC